MEFEILDMSCGGCASAITRAVTGVDLAAKLDIDVTTKYVKVDSTLAPDRVLAAIEAAGFHPTLKA
ncbi:heavy-metal-associated domain-containing protein [Paraburkholderia elongata]|uniref:Heavy metal transporter n=1 Tax=Paraburkholderia elongata TaxID=2675747 RepID=A0A972NJ73_9BURK|nr:heavy-metal-associated domain-containing protein [Paraburkholderia elongata]NPT54366.1 heavy metal transporter [Paraburkholderia elongata]